MTMQERADYAAKLKHQGHNCAQAVTAALADETSLSPETLSQIASGFAVGMGNMEATCGSLVGAAMIAGLKVAGKGTIHYTRHISEEFRLLSGATICKDLKSRKDGRVLCSCDQCVKNAVLAYGKVMGL